MDFKWEMQERIDQGMSPEQAYNATRDAYAGFYDNRDKFAQRHPEEVEYAKRETVDERDGRFECDDPEGQWIADQEEAADERDPGTE